MNGSRPVTASDVARAAGVSQSAVSRAFTPSGSVAPATRERIMREAERLGYRPNAIARSLIKGRSRLVGVVMGYLQNQFYPEVLDALSGRLRELDYHPILFTADADRSADRALEAIMRYRVDGLVIASARLSSALTRECVAAGVPIVLLNRTVRRPGISTVTGANTQGARAIAEFLAEAGHHRFGYVAGLEDSSTSRERERAFSRWLVEHGYERPARAVGNYSMTGAAEATRTLLRTQPRPEAIFCANDHMAIAAIDVARSEFGLRVGADVSIVGFDDVGPARWPSYDLTTYSQPVPALVDETVSLLMELIEQPTSPVDHRIVPGELVIRSSARTSG